MIDASRFLVRSSEREAWLEARRHRLSATQVAHAATPAGFQEVLEARRNGWSDLNPHIPGHFAQFGTESEAELLRYAHREHGILPSDWLIAGDDPRDVGTPDGLSLLHDEIAEAKTTSDPWDGAEKNIKKIPILYRRQVQWNLHVTKAKRCLLVWNIRVPDNADWFYLGWIEPRHVWIYPDEKMISELVATRDRLFVLEDH